MQGLLPVSVVFLANYLGIGTGGVEGKSEKRDWGVEGGVERGGERVR